ncbi:hypothetical protein [Aureispira anguillae]|uniref:Uncharacterized protein n=1 Tax=Aureispira anguillae TaxID=2864201 RepID=A0A916DSV0_9BACT|nr:hypothetical protein [Aureispira anguillae]BDS12759.1 hypothetical protein AsAng_0034840 [Aureispira anguillae]
MEKEEQGVIISFPYENKHIAPAKELAQELELVVQNEQLGYVVWDSITLEFDVVRMALYGANCEQIFEAIKPTLTNANIKAMATITLKFGQKEIDVEQALGEGYEEMDQEEVKKVAKLLQRKLPPKHGFLLVAYSTNGKMVEVLTEKGVPDPEELMKVYAILVSNMM